VFSVRYEQNTDAKCSVALVFRGIKRTLYSVNDYFSLNGVGG